MSKSIYEEAIDDLKILLYDEFDDTPNNPRLNATERLDKFKKVRDTIGQAQKQDKVLYQIKEIIGRHDWKMMTESERYYEIKELIKELEYD